MKAAGTDITLRRAVPHDAATLMAFAEALALEEGANCRLNIETLQRWLEEAEALFMLAERGGAPVGMAMAYTGFDLESGTRGRHFGDLYVHPSARRIGVGAALLREVARWTLGEGGAWLSWTVLDSNEAAHLFYRSLKAADVPVRFQAMGPRALQALVNSAVAG